MKPCTGYPTGKLLRVVRRPTGGGGWWYDYIYEEEPMSPKAEPIGEYRGYKLYLPTSGGKAGADRNKTSSLQICNGNQIIKQIRFNVEDGHHHACDKARKFIDERRKQIRNET